MKDNDFDIRLGQWLKAKRQEQHRSLQSVADALGVTRTAVHCWETGKRSLYASTLLDVCAVLGADLNEFTEQENNHVSQ